MSREAWILLLSFEAGRVLLRQVVVGGGSAWLCVGSLTVGICERSRCFPVPLCPGRGLRRGDSGSCSGCGPSSESPSGVSACHAAWAAWLSSLAVPAWPGSGSSSPSALGWLPSAALGSSCPTHRRGGGFWGCWRPVDQGVQGSASRGLLQHSGLSLGC